MSLRSAVTPTWRYALLAGLAALPFVGYSYWQSGGTADVSILVLTALVAGYLAKRRGLESTAVGVRAGLVVSPVVLWQAAELVPTVLGFDQPVWVDGVMLVAIGVFTPLLVLVVALVGGLGARLGGWLAERNGHPRGAVAG